MFKKFLIFFIFSHSLLISSAYSAKKVAKIAAPIPTSIVVDGKNGAVLHTHNSNLKVYPASLTKLMTLYVLFEKINSGKISLDKKLLVSKKAEKMLPCKLGLKSGEYITVREAILALMVKSANDAAVTVAEGVSGSEKAFAHEMNLQAKKLRMNDTYFKNASGWHDPLQKTTARDMAKLAMALKQNHPKFYPLFAKTSFTFRGNIIRGHNKVTENYQYAEGLKTGYTIPSGFNLVTTASKNNKSLIAVVTGGKTAASRDKAMIALLDKHFHVTPVKLANTKSKIKISKKRTSKNKIS